PVRVYGMRKVPFVARGLGQQAVARAHVAGLILRRQSLAAQPLNAADGLVDDRPHLREERAVAGEAILLHHRIDELAMAVMLDEPVDAVAIDYARDESVFALKGRIPADELAHRVVAADAQQRSAHDRAVADPRACVTPRSGLKRRPVAIDEDVCCRGPERVDFGRYRRNADLDFSERLAPLVNGEL